MTISAEATVRSIDEIPDLMTMAGTTGTEGFSEDFAEFFVLDTQLLRSGERRLVVFRYEDLRKISAHPFAGMVPAEVLMRRAFLDDTAPRVITDDNSNHLARFLTNQVFTANPPIHGPTRQNFARPLAIKHMAKFAEIATPIVDDLLDQVIDKGEIDFGFDFTERLTARFWGTLYDMTPEEQDEIVSVVAAMTPLFFIERTPEETTIVNTATGRFLDLIANSVHRSLERGGNELLEAMKAEYDSIALEGKPVNIGLAISSNVIDGFHTAALGAANIVYLLLQHPDALAAVRADPALMSNAINEGFRMFPPVITTHRYALEDFEYGGFHIPRGTAMAMLWAAGNRDPELHENPNTYDIYRRQKADTTFGGGLHICPGRNIGRMIAETVLKRVVRPEIDIQLSGPFDWIARSTMRQPHRMPVTITRA